MSKLCIFGEVLFDQFPDGQSVLGGAPFNVAWHLQAFGLAPLFVSAIGRDANGDAILKAMQQWNMKCNAITQGELPTGIVDIQFDNREPRYDIVSPSAWDFIHPPSSDAAEFEMLYHGSLALRHAHNQHSLEKWKLNSSQIFLDINLRDPWWDKHRVLDMVGQCDWLKLNIDELNLLYPSSQSSLLRLQNLIENHQLMGVIFTRGSEGAELMTANHDWHEVTPDKEIEIVDTVGAGDAFTSVIITGLIQQWPMAVTLQRAQLFASAIVERRGATVSDPTFYQPFIQQWSLDQ